jgi:hypothetical protein
LASGTGDLFLSAETGQPLCRDLRQPELKPKHTPVIISDPVHFWIVDGIPYRTTGVVAVAAPLASAALRWLRVRERRRRVRLGLYLACGYDLRHSPDKCPEMFSLL